MNESVASRTWTFEEDGTIDEVVLQLNTNEKYQNMSGTMKHNLRQILHMFPSDADMKVVCFGEHREDGGGEVNVQVTVTPKVQETQPASPEPSAEQMLESEAEAEPESLGRQEHGTAGGPVGTNYEEKYKE